MMNRKQRYIPGRDDVVMIDAGVRAPSVSLQLACWWGDAASRQIFKGNVDAARDAARNAAHYAHVADTEGSNG